MAGDPGVFRAETSVMQVEAGVWRLDLGFQGRGEVVAAYLLFDGREAALIETGPSSCLPTLLDGVRRAGVPVAAITKALVTHIHLDHSGAAGVLARDNPDLMVYMHPFGAPHMVDPGKLAASAARIYGDRMDALWGEIAPIGAGQMHALEEGEVVRAGGRDLTAVFTPGHAWHHVAYSDGQAGAAFTGDVAGVRMPGTGYVCPPTPPPDLDEAAWRESIGKLRALHARRWHLTHFGTVDDAAAHLDQLEANLDEFLRLGDRALDDGADGEALTALLHAEMSRRLGPVDPGLLVNLEWATPSYMAALGLIRRHKKRGEMRDKR